MDDVMTPPSMQRVQSSQGPAGMWSLALIPLAAVAGFFAAKRAHCHRVEPLDLSGPYRYNTYTMLSAAGALEASEAPAPEASEAPSESPAAPKEKVPVEKSYAKIIESIDKRYMKTDVPDIQIGDTLVVGVRIKEGEKERIQDYQGVAIALNNGGVNRTVTVRAVLQGVGVERGFPLHCPQVAYFKILKRAKVRRAKLYYLRGRSGKAARLKMRVDKPKAAAAK